MSSLILTFEDVYKRVSEFLTGDDIPTDKDLRKVKEITLRGYRKFLSPTNMRNGKPHVWQFLIEHSVLVTTSGKWIYELPANFSGKMFYFEHDTSAVYPTLQYVSVQSILSRRKTNNTSSYPNFYAVRSGRYDKVVGQFYELLLHDTPNAAYKLLYSYKIDPPKLENATDYFIGGVGSSEAIIECALAVAELQERHVISVHNKIAAELVQGLISSDDGSSPDSMGYNLDPSVNVVSPQRYLETIPENTVYL